MIAVVSLFISLLEKRNEQSLQSVEKELNTENAEVKL